MTAEKIDTLVVGAGQAGIAMSEHLGKAGIPHLVVERDRIAERWRSGRWDAMVANGPAWHDRFPGMDFPGDPEAFAPKEAVADYFVAYAERDRGADPLRGRRDAGDPARGAGRLPGGDLGRDDRGRQGGGGDRAFPAAGFPAARSGDRRGHAAALGRLPQSRSSCRRAACWWWAPAPRGRRSPRSCSKPGARSGSRSGRTTGRRGATAGATTVWWLGVLNKWDVEAPPTSKHVTFAVSGAHGGRTVDFRRLAARGVTLVGRAEAFEDGAIRFAPGLAEALAAGDANYLSVLDEADAWVARNAADLPDEPEARVIPSDPPCVTDPLRALDLAAAGIGAIVWATGYGLDFGWLKVDAFDAAGKPRHQRGVSSEPGIYFLGLPWLSRRGSSFIWGVWHDATLHRRPYRDPARLSRLRAARRQPRERLMAHTRIRKFNTRETYPEQNLDNDLCQAVVTQGGRIVWLRGQCPQDLDTARSIDEPRPGRADPQGDAEHPAADRGGGREDGTPGEGRRVPDRRPPPGSGLPHDGRIHPRRAPGLDGPGGDRAGAARVAGRDRRHRRDPGL